MASHTASSSQAASTRAPEAPPGLWIAVYQTQEIKTFHWALVVTPHGHFPDGTRDLCVHQLILDEQYDSSNRKFYAWKTDHSIAVLQNTHRFLGVVRLPRPTHATYSRVMDDIMTWPVWPGHPQRPQPSDWSCSWWIVYNLGFYAQRWGLQLTLQGQALHDHIFKLTVALQQRTEAGCSQWPPNGNGVWFIDYDALAVSY